MSDSEKPSRPACANCARRKTKCDRNSPCSCCVAAKFQCRYLQKRPEKKRRVLHSTRYEESLTDIRHQLDALSSTLQSIVEKDQVSSGRRSSNDGSNSTPSSAHIVASLPFGKESPTHTDQRDYEGESSFYSQSRRIADDLSLAVSSATKSTTDAQAAVVQSLIHDAKTADSSMYERDWSYLASSSFSQYPELASLSLPPMDAVLRMLTFVKTCQQRYFDYPYVDQDEFAELCQKLYFPTQPYTIFAWIIVNCGLLYLFRDLDTSHYDKLRLSRSQVADIVNDCTRNVDQAIKNLRLCISPSHEAVAALVTAGAVYMERASGSTAWKMIPAAARMSIDLGYHRLPHGYGDKERSKKRKLFWFVYSMDKSLAFNFGRTSIIQDFDVTTERPSLSEDFEDKWGVVFHNYIDFSTVQYDIYVQLFSATAQQDPLPIRAQRVHTFAAKLSDLRARFAEVLDPKDIVLRGTEICLSSVLTLIYRILPPDDDDSSANGVQQSNETDRHDPLRFHPLCIEAGRTALKLLLNGWNEVSSDENEDTAKAFVNWTLHHIPFMPFIAVLGNQIATSNLDDLQLLRQVTAIVGKAAQSNDALNKLYNAFSRLLRIAELWRNTSGKERSKEQGQHQPLRTGPKITTHGQQPPQNADRNGDSSLLSNGTFTTTDPQNAGNTGTDFTNWQDPDVDMMNQDWDMMFNEFDLGLGAESARDMMPWFEQHVNGFNANMLG